jgi:hypothetical protein
MKLRVTVPEVWDHVELAAEPEWTVERVKREALASTTGRKPDGAAFEVKFRGAKVLDESATLAALGVPDNAALIVLRIKREPVK